jgi:hypothetical protein
MIYLVIGFNMEEMKIEFIIFKRDVFSLIGNMRRNLLS